MIIVPERVEKVALRTPNVEIQQVSGMTNIDAIIDLAKAAHEESRFSYIPFSAAKIRKIGIRVLNAPDQHCVFLATNSSGPIGFTYASVGEFHIGEGVLISTIHVLNVPNRTVLGLSSGKAAIGLMKAVKEWSAAKGAKEILFSVTAGIGLDQSERFANRLGFEEIGGNYVSKTIR